MHETKIWKIGTIVLACISVFLLLLLLIGLSVNEELSLSPFSFSNVQQIPSEPSNPQQPTAAADTSENQIFSNPITTEGFKYPSSSFFLDKGVSSVGLVPVPPVDNQSFALTLQPYDENAKPMTFAIPISNFDYVQEPKISYDEKYGCVRVGSSGYWGYYIFSLPSGDKIIDQGRQYSNCVEWISDHQVIIVEQPWNTFNVMYSILDVRTKQKQVISSFSNE